MKMIKTVGELKEFLEDLNDNDLVVIETTVSDLAKDGDLVIETHPFRGVVILNVKKLANGEYINEVRFCQENNKNKQHEKRNWRSRRR
jgi:hypothetical protein